MFSFRIIINLILLSIVFGNRNCFTMPPKITQLKGWYTSLQNTSSIDYIHNTYECPDGYVIENSYSNTVKECNDEQVWNILSYAICCEGGSQYILDYLFNR